MGSVEFRPSEWVYSLTSSEIAEMRRLLATAAMTLDADRHHALPTHGAVGRARMPELSFVAELREIERTNAELAAGPNAIIEEVIDAAAP